MEPLKHVRTVTPSEANDLIAENDPVIIDVRTPAEYREAHIDGAVNLPVDDLNSTKVFEICDDVDRPILVYCAAGVRSRQACDKLVAMGFMNIYDMVDGINAWPFGLVS